MAIGRGTGKGGRGTGKSGKLPGGGFADNAIGFYLEMQDNLSPAIASAATNYQRFTQQMTRVNDAAVAAATKGMSALADAANVMGGFAAKARAAYADARKAMQEEADANPITQPVRFGTPQGKKGGGASQEIVAALSKALSRVNLRLTATLPKARNVYFDLGDPMRTQYKRLVQPPDMIGTFQNLPQFAKGGPVGGKGPGDSVMAILHKGEEVLTKGARATIAALLKGLSQAGRGAAPEAGPGATMGGVTKQLNQVDALVKRAGTWKEIAKAGFDPKAVEVYNKALAAASQRMEEATKSAMELNDSLNPGLKALLARRFEQSRKALEGFTGAMQGAGAQGKETMGILERVFTRLIGPTGVALAIHSFKTIEEHFQRMRGEVGKVYNTDDVVGFAKQSLRLGNQLGMQRDQQLKLRAAMVTTADTMSDGAFGIYEVSAAYDRAADAGARTVAEFKVLAPITAALAAQDINLTDSLFALNKTLDPRQMVAYSAAMVAAKQQTGLATDVFQSLSTTVTEALAGAPDQVWKLTEALAFSGKDATLLLEQFRRTKDVTPILTALVDSMAAVGANTEQAGALMKTLGIDAPLGVLQAMAGRGKEMAAAITQASTAVADARDPMLKLADAAKPNIFGWERLINYIGIGVNKYFPNVIAFFEEWNPSLVLAITNVGILSVSLLKSLIPALWSGSVALVKFIAGLFTTGTAATVAATTSTAAGAAMTAAGGGAAAGAAGFVAFFTAMNGLVAALPGIAIFLGIVLALAVAIRIMAPVIQTLASAFVELFKVFVGPVMMKAIDGLVAITQSVVSAFQALASMPASAILASAASLLLLGPAFAGIGFGLGTLGLGAGSAAVGVGSLLLAMRVLSGGGMSFADSIGALLCAFAVDPAQAQAATAGIQATSAFLASFAGMMATTTLAIGSDLLRRGTGVFSFLLSGQSPLSMLADSAKSLVATVNSLTTSMAQIRTGSRDQVLGGLAYTGDLFRGLSTVLTGAQQVGGIAGAVRDSWWGLVSGPLSQLDKAARPLRETINRVSGELAQITPTADVAERMGSVAAFLQSTEAVMASASNLSRRGPELRIERATVTDLRQAFSVTPVTPEEIRQTLDLVSAQGEMVGLLRQQLEVLRSIDTKVGGPPSIAPAPAAPATPRVNPLVRNLTEGR